MYFLINTFIISTDNIVSKCGFRGGIGGFTFFGKNDFIKKVILLFIALILAKFLIADNVESSFFRTGTIFRFDAILLGFILRFFHEKLFKLRYLSLIVLFISIFIFYFVKDYVLANE